MNTTQKYGIALGLVFGLISIVTTMLADPNPEAQSFSIMGIIWWLARVAVVIAVAAYAVKNIRDSELGGAISFGQAFTKSYGVLFWYVLTTLIISALNYYVINPDWFPMTYDQFVDAAQSNASADMDETGMKMIEKIYNNMNIIVLVASTVWLLIGAVIEAVIASLFVTKEDEGSISL